VVSVARLRDPNPDRFLNRVVKEAVHELGHTWGLGHCDSPTCVMHHSESVEDADAKNEGFCRTCGGRILFGIGKP
jgi:archaemetzincin